MEQVYKKRIHLVRIFAILGFLAAMAYTPKLWITNSGFPKIPRFDFIPIPQSPWDYIFSIGLVILLIAFLFKPKKYIGISIVLLYFYLAMVDQNRLQPYFYESILIILVVSYLRKSRKNTTIIMHCLMLIFIATYFWSGIHKFNANFNAQWMHALNKHFSFIPEIIRTSFTYSVAAIETLMGVFLLFNKTRKLGVIAIVLMHITIVGTLIWLGYGFNVIPWNLQNILSVIVLFWAYKSEADLDIFSKFYNLKKAIILFMVFVLPTSNLFGFWDHLLSFSFFSSKLNYYYVEILDDDLYKKLPDNIKQYTQEYDDKHLIYLNSWAGAVNQVLLFPEDRVAKKVEKYIQSFADNPNKEGLTKMVEYNHDLLKK
jgi:hypothetical protein